MMEKKEEEENEEEECLCSICLVKKADSAPIPCGHVCACYQCLKTVFRSSKKLCPICRAYIREIHRVHMSVAPSKFKSTSQAVAEPFKSYGITKHDARRALNETNNDIAAAGRRLVQIALSHQPEAVSHQPEAVNTTEKVDAEQVDVEELMFRIEAARQENDCESVIDVMREGKTSPVVVEEGCSAVRDIAMGESSNQKRIADAGGIP